MESVDPINEGDFFIQLFEILDNYLFIKNGYLILKHVIPIMIESMLLLVISISEDDLLLKLANSLNQRIYLPALLLTIFSFIIYYSSVLFLIKKAYLLSNHDYIRSIVTSLLSIIICVSFVLVVLNLGNIGGLNEETNNGISNISPGVNKQNEKSMALTLDSNGFNDQITWSGLLACLLIALLSLLGIGWSIPDLNKLVGLESPDYEGGRDAAIKLSEVLARTSSAYEKDLINRVDLTKDFNDAVDNLITSIDKNNKYEPSWEKTKLSGIRSDLDILCKAKIQTDVELKKACSGWDPLEYNLFFAALRTLKMSGVIANARKTR
jgi:hypothetical protein